MERLNTLTNVLKKSEVTSNQLQITKKRLDKFKKESLTKYQKEAIDKSSEIEVLKEMMKGV
jgi:hypothetical protein